MKRILALVLSVMMLLTMMGCGDKETTNGTVPKREIAYDQFVENFEKLFEPLEDQYELRYWDWVSSEDKNFNTTAIFLTDKILGDEITVYVTIDENEDVRSVSLTEERHSYGNMQFAVFCFYVYQSMELKKISADEFYDQYDLLSKGKVEIQDTVDGWFIFSQASEDTEEYEFVYFSISNFKLSQQEE